MSASRTVPKDAIPLPTRAFIARGVSSVLAAMMASSGIVAATTPPELLPLPRTVLTPLIVAVTLALLVVAVTPFQRRLQANAQELLLASITGIPATAVVIVHMSAGTVDGSSLQLLSVLFTASALTMRLRVHTTLVTVLLLAAVANAMLRGAADSDLAFPVLVAGSVAVLSGFAARVIGRTLATAAAREADAEASSRALMAVVDAARAATTEDIQQVLDTVVQATERLNSDIAGIYLLGPDGQLRYGATVNVPESLQGEVFPPEHGLAGAVLTQDGMIVTNDYQQFAASMPEYRENGLRAAIGAPIRVHDDAVGVLVAGRYEPGSYDEAACTAFELLADHAGRALTLARAIDEDRQVLDRLRSLRALQEDFVATISHELRTPLTVIDGMAETLLRFDERLDASGRGQLLTRLRSNTEALTRIVTSLLDTARLDQGLVEVDHEPVRLRAVVEGCVARLAPVLATHDVVVEVDDVVVRGDAALLERVVDNLLTNAERHTPAGTTVRIWTELRDEACTMTLADDGPGIAAADLAGITERFTRGGDHHTRTTRGLGLGLALCDQVLRLHGTRLTAESTPGKGATFRFTLPLSVVDAVEAPRKTG